MLGRTNHIDILAILQNAVFKMMILCLVCRISIVSVKTEALESRSYETEITLVSNFYAK